MLTRIDVVVVVLYGVLVAFLGYYAKGMIKSSSDYFCGNKRVPWWLRRFPTTSQVTVPLLRRAWYARLWQRAERLDIFWPTDLYRHGGWFPDLGASLVTNENIYSVEYLETRYNKFIRQLFAWSGIGIKFIDEGIKLYSLAVIVHVATGWPMPHVIIACGIVTIVYLFFGRSVGNGAH
jgi:SSS family solute:Na+ symporter